MFHAFSNFGSTIYSDTAIRHTTATTNVQQKNIYRKNIATVLKLKTTTCLPIIVFVFES